MCFLHVYKIIIGCMEEIAKISSMCACVPLCPHEHVTRTTKVIKLSTPHRIIGTQEQCSVDCKLWQTKNQRKPQQLAAHMP